MSPTSTWVAPTTPANGAVTVVNVCAALACTALALSAATCAWAALSSASDWSTAAWLTNFRANRLRLRSCLRRALARFASDSATCDRLAATACSAVRASMRTSTWPLRTVSPALTASSVIRPGTCAPSVAWRTASTTPSAATACGRSRTTASNVGPTPAAAAGAAACAVTSAGDTATASSAPAVSKRAKRPANMRCIVDLRG